MAGGAGAAERGGPRACRAERQREGGSGEGGGQREVPRGRVRGGAVSAARCRRTLARDNDSAAQTAEVKPLPVGNAIAAAIMISRCAPAPAPSRPEVPPLFFGWQ